MRNKGGNIALRVPKSLHQRIVRLAATEGVSMNPFLLAIVAEGVARQELQLSVEKK
jgi:predicted HicB family RNase H-like nuclease